MLVSLALSLACWVAGCRGKEPVYPTWASQGDKPYLIAEIPQESALPNHAIPWAGTVSHHLLVGKLIDKWFRELASRRQVERFFVLSPSHWGLSAQPWSLTDGYWLVPDGNVRSDKNTVYTLARKLGVPLEPRVFSPEHGISTLIPYIFQYFPHAMVVAIAYIGEPPLDQPKAQHLFQALSPYFSETGKKKNFLLISTDFAHHGNDAVTKLKDDRTRIFFAKPSPATWIFAGCDNRPGMYVLSRLFGRSGKCTILYHTNSFAVSGQEAQDITSYFFTCFWEESAHS